MPGESKNLELGPHSPSFEVIHRSLGEGPLPERTLARIEFGTDPSVVLSDPRRIPVGLQTLDGIAWTEHWLSQDPVRYGCDQGVSFAENGTVLFGSFFLDEPELERLQRATLRAYARIDQRLNDWGFPHWMRAWHFLARITEGEGEQERYRRFNAGRYRAIELRGGPTTELPAATAIGTHSRGLTICFLAGKEPTVQVENPRQLSAFRYPDIYGKRSPSFSRAALRRSSPPTLFVSGTASIVGHATVHHGDIEAQTLEAARNIEALLDETTKAHLRTNQQQGLQGQRLKGLAHKVYVRHPSDWEQVSRILNERLPAEQPLIGLHADICRPDLLVEIEGIYGAE